MYLLPFYLYAVFIKAVSVYAELLLWRFRAIAMKPLAAVAYIKGA